MFALGPKQPVSETAWSYLSCIVLLNRAVALQREWCDVRNCGYGDRKSKAASAVMWQERKVPAAEFAAQSCGNCDGCSEVTACGGGLEYLHRSPCEP
jgi:hypothetical protein